MLCYDMLWHDMICDCYYAWPSLLYCDATGSIAPRPRRPPCPSSPQAMMRSAENSWLYALFGWVPADHDRLYWVWQDDLWDDAGITPQGRDGDDVGLKSEDNDDDGHEDD